MGEGALAFDSPNAAAALMASLGSHGLTPLPIGPDGLGISSGLHAATTKDGSVTGGRNVEEERIQRLQDVIKTLRAKAAGRGVDRAGVARLAQMSGFTYFWDDDILIIAGNHVGLDITFDHKSPDRVNDVVLKINVSGIDEPRTNASAILKKDLEWSLATSDRHSWSDITNFAANLTELGQLDQLSQGVNCFEAIDGLSHTFRKIWEEEEKRLPGRSALTRLCQGTSGHPRMNARRQIGLSLEYWVETREVLENESTTSGDAMTIVSDSETVKVGWEDRIWSAKIRCEPGYPPIRIAKRWVSDNVFEVENDTGTDGSAWPTFSTLNWNDPDPTLVAPTDIRDASSSMLIDGGRINIPKSPNVRFLADFAPTVVMPYTLLSSLATHGLIFKFDHNQVVTYQQALHNLALARSGEKEIQQSRRWRRKITLFDRDGQAHPRQHTYAVYSSNSLWCCHVQSMVFDHPRQLAEIFPILRQYVLVWSIIRKLVPDSFTSTGEAVGVRQQKASVKEAKRGTQRKSNRDVRGAKLDSMLDPSTFSQGSPQTVDVSISLSSSNPPAVKLDVIMPLFTDFNKSAHSTDSRFASVGVEIGFGGKITVVSTGGLPATKSEAVKQKIAKVLSLSEDLSVLVQWLLDGSHLNS